MFAFSGITEKQDKVVNHFDELPEESKTSYIRIFELVNDGDCSSPASIEEVQTLLEANQVGVHANIRQLTYGGALINSCLSSYDMTKMLLEHGANPNLSDLMDAQTPMDHLAEDEELYDDDMDKEAISDIKKMRELLVEHGAKRSALSQVMMDVSDDNERESLWRSVVRGEDDNSLDGSDTEEEENVN